MPGQPDPAHRPARATHSVEYLGVAPTGRAIETRGIVMHEVRGGKLTNFWLVQDDLGTIRQLTAGPARPNE
jgi:predicted ester cyclase